jgi:hypothetical protein
MWGCLEIRGLVVVCGSEEGGEIFGIIWDEQIESSEQYYFSLSRIRMEKIGKDVEK